MPGESGGARPEAGTIRLMTYNVHSCRGTDRAVDPTRVAEAIAACGADIVALQELDVGRSRTGGIDQAQAIAAHLKVTSHFNAALHIEEERYGDAILTALPSRLVKAGPLPSLGEPRGALWVAVDVGGAELNVFNTHFGLRRAERMRQAAAILGAGWLGSPDCGAGPCVLLGDFNSVPSSAAYRSIAHAFADAARAAPVRARPTFPSRLPTLRLDHIFVGPGIDVVAARTVSTRMARLASDHLPLVADIRIGV